MALQIPFIIFDNFFFWGGRGGMVVFLIIVTEVKKKLPGRGIQETVMINSDSMNIDSLT